MDLLDANVLIGAFRPDHPDHAVMKGWLEEALNAGRVVTFPVLVEVAFLRIVTHPRIFKVPSSVEEAVAFLQNGNDVNDAYLAAAAAETQSRLVSRDGGFDRFPGLDRLNPAD